jgi:hypothetical protein
MSLMLTIPRIRTHHKCILSRTHHKITATKTLEVRISFTSVSMLKFVKYALKAKNTKNESECRNESLAKPD